MEPIEPSSADASSQAGMRCLLLSPSDPITRGPRSAAALRYRHPPRGVEYTLETDRFSYPRRLGYYGMDPASVGLAAFRFFLEHALPQRNHGHRLVHSFFWDLHGFDVPWVHESDQSLGQFVSGYAGVGGPARDVILNVFSTYLNSSRCRAVVTWTEWARKGFVEDGVEKSKVAVIPPPFQVIDDRRPHPGCNVLFLGRDFRRKGGAMALRAFASASAGMECRLFYVGRIDDPARLREARADSRIAHLENPSSRVLAEDVWPLTDVLLLPTNNDAFAMVVAEAMRRGVPVVASGLEPLSEVVEDGVTGFLVEKGDLRGFASSLRRLIESPDLRLRMGEAARSRSSKLFSPSKVGSALAEVYRR